MVKVIDEDGALEAEKLTDEQIEALGDSIRIEILRHLSKEPAYPSSLSEKFECSKQKLYYHFEKLEEAGLIEQDRTENVSGGEATFFKSSRDAFAILLNEEFEDFPLPDANTAARDFLEPFIEESKIKGYLVAGSPDQHGPDQVRARDGHLTSEIAFKLGNYARKNTGLVKLDTEIVAEKRFNENLFLVGGVLTNTVAKRFSESFPAYFPDEEFPYRELRTPDNSYGSGDIGVIAKTSNPEEREKSIFLVAGVQQKGTRAAVKAFSDLEEIVENYEAGQFYAVVKGLDLNSDGSIDDYRVIETSE
jgi:DNA-binding transcriptional ArsR family regulator